MPSNYIPVGRIRIRSSAHTVSLVPKFSSARWPSNTHTLQVIPSIKRLCALGTFEDPERGLWGCWELIEVISSRFPALETFGYLDRHMKGCGNCPILPQCRRTVIMWQVVVVGLHRNRLRRVVQKWRNLVYMERTQDTLKQLNRPSFCDS